MKKSLLALSLLLAMTAGNANAFELGFRVGGDFAKLDPPTGQTNSSQFGLGYGLVAGMDLVPSLLELELDVMMLNRKYKSEQAAANVNWVQSMNFLHIPLIVRFTGLPVVNFGAGIAYSTGMGKIKVTDSSNTALVANSEFEFDDPSALKKKSETSLVLAVGAKFSLAPAIKAVADFRYNIGLSNLNNDPALPNDTYKSKEMLALAGLSLEF